MADHEPHEPFAGDPGWRTTHELRDGSIITIRPIVPEDRTELKRQFDEASAETRYLRFLGAVGDLTDAMLTYLTCVDQKDHIALVATMASPDLKTERGVGVARVIRLENEPEVGEAAITVSDDMHRRGIGSRLAYELERAARVRGIRHIRADVLESNAAMRSILEHAGARRVDASSSPGTIAYDIELPSDSPAASDPPAARSGLADVLRGAAQTMAMSIRKLVPSDVDQ